MPRDVIFTDTCEAGRFIIAFLSFSLFSLSSPCDGNTILVEVHDFQLHECWMEPDKEKLFWQEMCFGESMSNCLTWCIFEFLTFPWLDAVDAGCSPISQRQHSSNLKKPRNFYKIFPIEMSMWSAILQKLLKVDIPRCHGFPFWSTWGVFFWDQWCQVYFGSGQRFQSWPGRDRHQLWVAWWRFGSQLIYCILSWCCHC